MEEKTVSAILLAAGGSTRMGLGKSGERINKMTIKPGGESPIALCVRAFSAFADEIVIVVSDKTRDAAAEASLVSSVPVKIVLGGERRQDSVLNGVTAAEGDIVAIHDCARCLVSGDVIERAIERAKARSSGVAAVKVRDTLRRSDTGETVEREGLVMMQTPQCFDRQMLLEAYDMDPGDVTDDAAVWQKAYGKVELTEGSIVNQKLTEQNDIAFFDRMIGGGKLKMRIGIGEDTHRLVEGRRLVLGGVDVPFRLGLLGHSDADALIHAIIDAMLGAAALGDIGRLFPDRDPQYKDISSLILLERAANLLEENGFAVSNIDATITAQEPKLAPYIDEMRKRIADAIPRIGIEDVSVKATTPEHTGPEGNLECITVRAVACVGRL
ncbi:MAG: 2-C-methyl-D-erythritol 2,4-cyclodiphosphate synthase [Clostridiales bacterium]|nr:2-C-methyl-D-erythritol 2,4-cyclodiphosphate synthase [Clostridiales bacterium]